MPQKHQSSPLFCHYVTFDRLDRLCFPFKCNIYVL
nr:MAG TPA: hypothetical protein [Caudoviricetes sp.]